MTQFLDFLHGFFSGPATTSFDISVRFFLQLVVILGTCRIVGLIGKYFGQPQVVCEMIAGVILGPSLFGLIFPEAQAWLFPKETKAVIFSVCQIGLSLYMFTIGCEFDAGLIRSKIKSAAAVSLAGIFAPFVLGMILSHIYFDQGLFFSPKTSHLEGMLYMGASMSITAFPMLARIIYERGLTGTALGTLSLAAGSIDDVMAWGVLAAVLASFGRNAGIAWMALFGGLGYVVFLWLVAAPLLKKLAAKVEIRDELPAWMLSVVLCALMLGSWFTDKIGLYAVFGAFMLGMAVPKGRLSELLQKTIQPLTVALLLPLFFINSGLNTKFGLIHGMNLWGIALLVLACAILGKGVACFLAAKASGTPTRDALAVGALMNARGLMELIILNIGRDKGVITDLLFSVMVLMAIVTTLMATPLFNWTRKRTA